MILTTSEAGPVVFVVSMRLVLPGLQLFMVVNFLKGA